MAPSPEDDNAPKAPDKCDKNKYDKATGDENMKEKDKEEKTLSNLNDGELKALLDEAITYKNPKDREGKSKLFKDLLIQAEESERIARATSAGGSELVRHCNPSARRNAAVGSQRHHQGRRKSSRRMASETVMHGGSLDNLAQEELFLESTHHLMMRDKQNKRTAVSARQREGGSLPCDVNSSLSLGSANQFFEEAKRKKAMKEKSEYTGNEVESYETQRLLDHDTLAQNYEEVAQEVTIIPRFTTRATLQISATSVDDPIPLDLDSGTDKKIYDEEVLRNKVSHSKYSVFIPTYNRTPEEKKIDENGNNALHQSNTKTKKKKKENVVVLNAESVEGHRSDIINDVDKLIQFIGGDEDTFSSSKPKSNFHKSKQLKHVADDTQRNKKQRAHSSKGKETRGELKKSNSLGEISTTILDNFEFSSSEQEENKVVMRTGKGAQNDRPKERRSWGNVEPPPFQVLSSNASTENLETAENWVVTKPKKKSKKRRNSISSGARRQNSASESTKQPTNRAPSPDLRGNTTRSVPHSEKSNDSSDADSVHSLPIDDLNMPISYADIAKNSEKVKEKKSSPEKMEKVAVIKEKSPSAKADQDPKIQPNSKKSSNVEKTPIVEKSPLPYPPPSLSKSPPDVNNIKNFPAISAEVAAKTPLTSPITTKPTYFQDIPIKNIELKPVLHQELTNEVLHHLPKSTITSSIDVAVNTKNTSSSSSSESCHSPHVPKNVQEPTMKNLPPDVHNIRNFPVMPNVNKNITTSEKNFSNSTKNNNLTVNSKVRNISPSKNVKSGHNNNNNHLKSSVRNASNVVHNDIQNDLTIIHSNEKESIQFNAQMLPPDIPDVRTIEKMHFMNLTPPNNVLVNYSLNKQSLIPNMKNSLSTTSPLQSSASHVNLSKVSHESTSVFNNASNNNIDNSKQTINSCSNSFNNVNVHNTVNYVNCDNSSDRTVVSETVVVVDNHLQQHQQQQQQHQILHQQEENDDEERPPPVVILSGLGNKEVPGLVFGFDINEQLLNEDICENFISRYVEPENFKNSTHNHDKIVNFIASTWEATITQSNGKVQYYKEES